MHFHSGPKGKSTVGITWASQVSFRSDPFEIVVFHRIDKGRDTTQVQRLLDL